MAFTVLVKRSNIAGRIPTTAQLSLGEVAVNTNDGILYFQQSQTVGNTVTNSIVTVAGSPTTISLTGGVTGTANFSGPNAVTITTSVLTANTQAAGDNTTNVATTAFVQSTVGSYLPLTGGTLTGNLTVNATSVITANLSLSYTDPISPLATANPTLQQRFGNGIVDILDYGCAADGVTDDSAKIAAAALVASTNGWTLLMRPGRYACNSTQIYLNNLCIRGAGVMDGTGSGTVGTVFCFYSTTQSPFTMGSGWQITGCNFFWPNQVENATAPIAYPAMLAATGSTQITRSWFDKNTVVNAFDFFNSGTNVTGQLQFTGNNIYAIRYVWQAQNAPDTILLSNNTISPGIYGGQVLYQTSVDVTTASTASGNAVLTFASTTGLGMIVGASVTGTNIAANTTVVSKTTTTITLSANTTGLVSSGASITFASTHLRDYTASNGAVFVVAGNGTTTTAPTYSVDGLIASNNYVFGYNYGIYIPGGSLQIARFVNTNFDGVMYPFYCGTGGQFIGVSMSDFIFYGYRFGNTSIIPSGGHFYINSPSPATSTTINTNASAVSGATVLNFASTTGVVIGASLSGTNVATTAYVVSANATSVTMSTGTTGTITSGQAITFAGSACNTLTIDNMELGFAQGTVFNVGGNAILSMAITNSKLLNFGHLGSGGPYLGIQTAGGSTFLLQISNNQFYPSVSTGYGIQVGGGGAVNITNNAFYNCLYCVDVESTSTTVVLGDNIGSGTTGGCVVGIGTSNVSDLGNSWDKTAPQYFPVSYKYTSGAVNFLTLAGGATGNGPSLVVNGGDTNIQLYLGSKGTYPVSIITNQTSEQFRVSHFANATNFVNVLGSSVGNAVVISASSASDPNPSITLTAGASGVTYLGSATSPVNIANALQATTGTFSTRIVTVTQPSTDSTTNVATTAFVQSANATQIGRYVTNTIGVSTTTATFTASNTLPTTTGLGTLWTGVITPRSTTSKIQVHFTSFVDAGAAQNISFAVFRGATCVAVTATRVTGAGSSPAPVAMTFFDSPATTSATTYTCYWGGSGTGTKYINQQSGANYGGTVGGANAWFLHDI